MCHHVGGWRGTVVKSTRYMGRRPDVTSHKSNHAHIGWIFGKNEQSLSDEVNAKKEFQMMFISMVYPLAFPAFMEIKIAL